MSNINDYLKWRGDIPLKEELYFNEIDSMILARFSYLIFDRIQMDETETISSISYKMREFNNDEFRYNGDKDLIKNLGKSIRFKNMKVTDFVQNNEKENEKQFGAITIHINENEMYVSFIGTNASIYGWKEDFNMAFMDDVPFQIEGKKYLENISEKYPKKLIRIGGHSKGGNVAIYSAISVEQEIQNKIIKVYNYDGPGFNKKIFDKYKDDEVIDKIETYFPQESIIGRILNHKEKCSVILSNQKGILQHDIYSWQVMGKEMISSQITATSEIINRTLTEWLENTSQEQREIFVNSIFELFYSTETNTFGEMSKNLTKNIPIMYKGYEKILPEDKKTINEMIKLFIKTGLKELYEEKKLSGNN